jgi:hypothetical protein
MSYNDRQMRLPVVQRRRYVHQVPKGLNSNAVAHAPRFSAGFPNSRSKHAREQRSQWLCIERLKLKIWECKDSCMPHTSLCCKGLQVLLVYSRE